MMNYYYSELKKQKELFEKHKQERQEKLYHEKRKKEMPQLLENYEHRIKQFLYKLAEKPEDYKIQDMKHNVLSTRKTLLAEEDEKILFNKAFVFKNYKTEKQRIRDYLEEKQNILFKDNFIPEREKSFNIKLSKSSSKDLDLVELIQPNMRFKARTDLERIVDAINKNTVLMDDQKKIIDIQLQNLGLNVVKIKRKKRVDDNFPSMIRANRYEEETEESEEKQKEVHNKIIEDRKEMIKKRKFLHNVDNSNAKSIRPELHNKTHFKAAEGYSLFKNTCIVHHEHFETDPDIVKDLNSTSKTKKKKQIFFRKPNQQKEEYPGFNPIENSISKMNNTTSENFFQPDNQGHKENKDGFPPSRNSANNVGMNTFSSGLTSINAIGHKHILNDPEVSKDIAEANPLLFNYNFNMFKNNNGAEDGIFNKEQLETIKKMAFAEEGDENYPIPRTEKKEKTGFFNKLSKRLSLSIKRKEGKEDGKLGRRETLCMKGYFFSKHEENVDDIKKPDEDKIKIGGENFSKNDLAQISKKILTTCNWRHEKNKNTRVFKSGGGKLMFTSGMTVAEFIEKHRHLIKYE